VDAVQTNLTNHAALANPHSATAAATADRLVLRDGAGRAQVVAPSVAADIARKDTVDGVQTNLNTHTALTTVGVHGSTVAPTASKLMHRDGSGRSQVAAPAAAADIARKDNVDTVQTNLNTHAALTGSSAHGAVSAPTPNQIMTRDAAGRAQVVAPSADADIAIKGWVRDFIYPVGCYYVQFPDASSNDDATEFPTSQRPATLFGGTWAEQWSTKSIYFRTRGTLSNTDRASGKQEDAFQHHFHRTYLTQGTGTNLAGYTGTVSRDPYDVIKTTPFPWSIAGEPIPGDGYGTPRTGTETRAVNRRIKVWKRTA
jgi:hypothetical protein